MSRVQPRQQPLQIGDTEVQPGKRTTVQLPLARLFTGTQLALTVVALHGRRPGPRVWLDAAIHGDELNGIRIIQDVLQQLDVRRLRGTLLAVPVVNVFGLIHHSRYLPDRRDLNRSFPGSARGSQASRLAHLFLEEVVNHCDIGIDLHTAGPNRTNLPHLRLDLNDTETLRLAHAFAPPLLYAAPRIAGSLRAVCTERGKRLLVYEAGEPLRFNDGAIHIGVAGVLRTLEALGMIDLTETQHAELAAPCPEVLVGGTSRWLRASRSGVFVPTRGIGERVVKGEVMGTLSDPVPQRASRLKAPTDGLILGTTVNPMVHQGDALAHVVQLRDPEREPQLDPPGELD